MSRIITVVLAIALFVQRSEAQPASGADLNYHSKPFVHPGMMQNKQDIDFIKQKVKAGEQPWKNAFDNLKKNARLDFKPDPRAHISVGPYGSNSSGGREYAQSATMAYHHALMWALTDEKTYADKAIEILNAWSPVLWDFDDNDAKLNVGLRGPLFLNAAEILKNTSSGWQPKDMEQFKRMVLTVFHPTIKDFFTEANGNWDASMIYTMLCIGVFTDNHEIFNKAVDRFYHGPGNSGITKYIYPNAQIQETTRDWDHAQLGIGEFGKAAQVAWTQGLDLYGAADNRLALGFEYASKFMLGDNDIPVYGVLSTRQRERYKDIYENIYQHYHFVKGIDMPYTAKAAENLRSSSGLDMLTAWHAPSGIVHKTFRPLSFQVKIPSVVSLVGSPSAPTVKPPVGTVVVNPGDSIQAAINTAAGKGGWVVLAKGVHTIRTPLVIPSGTTLAGQGKETILMLAGRTGGKTLINASVDLHDVVIRDMLIEGATSATTSTDPNAERRTRSYMSATSREGISFQAVQTGQMKNIRFENLTVQNFTKNGVTVRGAANVIVSNCDFSDNGSSVVPGAGFHHNLHLTRISRCEISNSRFDTSPWGNGIDLSFVKDVVISNNEAARNKLSGIRCTESENVKVTGNLTEGNDENGISFDALMDGSKNIEASNNLIQYNSQRGLLIEKGIGNKPSANKLIGNGNDK